ncbi:MAG: family N-acetyltransferase [Bacteroidetes bacterium]|jgi:predicted GNAT family acetyltransferase|nr:family N-acetyltransferase [Bacteroidota bacterium]
MEVKHRDEKPKGAFYIEENGKEIATMTYVFAGEGRFIIDHTVVDQAYEGKGLGRQLVKAGVGFARKNHLKIIPLCPYAKRILEKTPEYSDIF